LAPYHHCAGRLGLDPADVFDQAATGGSDWLAELVREFGRRTVINPADFAFVLGYSDDGPTYFSIW
jgi:hypothetical protein